MRYAAFVFLTLPLASLCFSQTLRPATVIAEFNLNGTPATFVIPQVFNIVTNPEVLKALPYPENQILYFALTPYSDHERRHVAIGSRPELDSHDISSAMFAEMGKSFDTDFADDGIQQSIEKVKFFVDELRSRKGLPGSESAKTLSAKSIGNAWIITAVVSNDDGTDFVTCVAIRHHKNRLIVISASSHLAGKEDIAWSVSTAESFLNSIR